MKFDYMNAEWKTFLNAQQELIPSSHDKCDKKSLFPLTHLGVITVSGQDASKLLQGQITCNVNDVSETNSIFAAMCNPKGRVIATFLLVKKADIFLFILPVELLDAVKKKLQMYVLRSDVKLADSSDDLCLLGICNGIEASGQAFVTDVQSNSIVVNFPAIMQRQLLILSTDNAIAIWSDYVAKGFHCAGSNEWQYLDIVTGIPWITITTSEEFIPQMLNLDKLGGISFNKGCYTGQEIVARTHYLGKAKREMVLAECNVLSLPIANTNIINDSDNDEQDIVGKVLLAQQDQQSCKMQIILQISESAYGTLRLQNDDQTQIKIIPFYL